MVGARGRGTDRSVAEWNEVKSRRVRRPGGPTSAVSWRGGLPRPADGVKAPGERNSRLLAGQGVGFVSKGARVASLGLYLGELAH